MRDTRPGGTGRFDDEQVIQTSEFNRRIRSRAEPLDDVRRGIAVGHNQDVARLIGLDCRDQRIDFVSVVVPNLKAATRCRR